MIKKIKSLLNLKKEDVKNEVVDINNEKLLQWLGIDPNTSGNSLSQTTYFTCLKILSESIGKLPIKMYQDTDNGIVKAKTSNNINILKFRPNPYMTPSIFWSTVERNRNHNGNAYVWCRYKRGQLQDLWIMQNEDVEVYIDDRGYLGNKNRIWYVYTDPKTLNVYTISSDDVLHFKTSSTFDGILGKPVKDILKDTIEGGISSQRFMNKLYKEGLTARAVLQYTGDLDKNAEKRLIEGLEKFANGESGAGKILPIPLGMQIQPLDIKLTDAQFFELKKYNALQIAAAFGIKPNHINDYSKSSYSNSEMQQLSFYVDTLQFILKQYEEEISYKLLSNDEIIKGYFIKFNEGAILRADMKTQMETLASSVNNGIRSLNEAREVLDLPRVEGGDKLIVNGNYIPIEMVGQQYLKGGEKSE